MTAYSSPLHVADWIA